MLSALLASAQTKISSPYSRFGIGDLHLNNNTTIMAMGGSSIALSSPLMVNFNNPASYNAIAPKSFVFEAGIINKFANLKADELSQQSNYTSLGHLVMAFPVAKRWRSGFGLLPYSNMGYKVTDRRSDELVGTNNQSYEGTGGVNQFYWGNSINLHQRLSVGFNLVYLFGSLEKNRSISFPDSVFKLGIKILNTTTVSDLKINTGLQYHHLLKDDYSLTFGLIWNPEFSINVKDKVLAYNYFTGSTGVDNVRDTLINSEREKGSMIIPAEYGAGIMLSKTNRWLIAADYSFQQWKNYRLFGRNDSLQNSMNFSVGAQLQPVSTTLSPYWKKMRYRWGIRYSQTYLELDSKQLNEFGISFGVGLPLSRTRSTINLGMELGRRGTTANNLIEETFFRFTAGFSILERWFEQRRYF